MVRSLGDNSLKVSFERLLPAYAAQVNVKLHNYKPLVLHFGSRGVRESLLLRKSHNLVLPYVMSALMQHMQAH